MALAFRRLVLVFTLLALGPVAATAATIGLAADFLNSRLTFGGPSFDHTGYDIYNLTLNDVDIFQNWDPTGTEFHASGGTLVSHTPAGYEYQGGQFSIAFELNDGSTQLFGTFTAPITSLAITAFEPFTPGQTGVVLDYAIGPGSFDPAFAAALGIPGTTGGSLFSFAQLILFDFNAVPPEHDAEDGGASFTFAPAPAPEPSLTVLVGLGLAAAVRARRKLKP